MKTKLLKKIRKRFEILYYPNGLASYSLGEMHVYSPTGLVIVGDKGGHSGKSFRIGDKKDEYTLELATKLAKEHLLKMVREKYGKIDNKKYKPVKLWYNEI